MSTTEKATHTPGPADIAFAFEELAAISFDLWEVARDHNCAGPDKWGHPCAICDTVRTYDYLDTHSSIELIPLLSEGRPTTAAAAETVAELDALKAKNAQMLEALEAVLGDRPSALTIHTLERVNSAIARAKGENE